MAQLKRLRADWQGMWRCFLILLCFVGPVWGHQTSDSYLSLQATNRILVARWAIALRDLNHVLTLDRDADGELSDTELNEARPRIEEYAFGRIKFSINGQTATPKKTGFDIQDHADAIYAALHFELEQAWVDLSIEYTLFNDTDPMHRGLLRLTLPDRTDTAIFSPAQPIQRFLLPARDLWKQFLNFLWEGVWHIWIGYDHILFLVALLLPSVLRAERIIWGVLKVVTAFTVAHSITLSLAALGWVHAPVRLVECVIAASVVVAALNNVKTFLPERTWTMALGFGLIHGFGFANVLGELDLDRSQMALVLLSFNVGVELGQLAIVLAFVPVAYAARNTRFYRTFAVKYGSLIIAALAMVWLVERALDRKLIPF